MIYDWSSNIILWLEFVPIPWKPSIKPLIRTGVTHRLTHSQAYTWQGWSLVKILFPIVLEVISISSVALSEEIIFKGQFIFAFISSGGTLTVGELNQITYNRRVLYTVQCTMIEMVQATPKYRSHLLKNGCDKYKCNYIGGDSKV